ncbi:maleylpyruvate isomerase family mycothiol-dependent enzyme [Streptomyces sp. NPDC052396]|uniref:maleylpyruvate isomerase family mycothiol-dependent enzyme n=1 Tax=Streptomyces sp. NPDC052396 TaxID=3365689 RepID=UPI0037D1D8E7
MDAADGSGPGAEHARTRAALRSALARLGCLLREAADRDAPSGLPRWTVGEVGAHLCAVHLAFAAAFTGEFQDWDRVLPPGGGPLRQRIAEVNARALALFREERLDFAGFIAERGEAFLEATEGLAPDTPVPTPWYGEGVALSLAAATGLLLSEILVHGLDIARGARLPWTVPADEARLVIGQSMPELMPLALDPVRAQSAHITFDLNIQGGPRLAVAVRDGRATVTRQAPPGGFDCRISAAPTAFLLVCFRRLPQWRAVARGRLRAGGRRPWLATRLSRLIVSP